MRVALGGLFNAKFLASNLLAALSLVVLAFAFAPKECRAEAGLVYNAGKQLNVYQTVGLASDGYVTTYKGNVSLIETTSQGVMASRIDRTVDASAGVSPAPHVDNDIPQTTSTLISEAKAKQSFVLAHLTADIKAYAKLLGATESSYHFKQRVLVQGNPNPKLLVWSIYIDSFGRVKTEIPKIITDIPTFVHLTYTPKKVADNLPSTWAYPDSGKYKYEIVDKNFNALTSSITVDANGAYDEPVAQTKPYATPYPGGCSIDDEAEMVCDPDYGLDCLIDKTSDAGCSVAYSDVITLIDQLGADGAYVDYVRALTPVYDDIWVGPGPDDYDSIARTSVSVDTRTWIKSKMFFFISPAGGAKYKNVGRYGFVLVQQTDRYSVMPSGEYTHTGSENTQTISPTLNYDKTVILPKGAKCLNYNFNIIDPFDTTTVYDWRNDTVNGLPQSSYTYVAPLGCF